MQTNPTSPQATVGQWGQVFNLQNVAIHTHLLPTGKVLYWGRRRVVGDTNFPSLNEHFCSTFLWDPATGTSQPTAKPPQLDSGGGVNLFCSGHSFLPDGRLLVVGGHLFDGEGVNQASVYDAFADIWTPLPRMNAGRWYPSALTLPDGGMLTISGSFAQGGQQPPPDNTIASTGGIITNPNPQILRGNAWEPTVNFQTLQLYPRLHVEPQQGRVFMAGPQGQSFFLDTQGTGNWIPGPIRDGALRDYAPSVMYQSGKILYMGGGQDQNTNLPTNLAETIDLNVVNPQWQQTKAPMHFPRRQHNATVLPDSTVLVTGGTQGIPGNSQAVAFNNVNAGGPVHQAELWDPTTSQWTLMAAESVDRCYHSTALLLPDGRVLSAGGGEWAPTPGVSNQPGDSYQNAQLFSPPYLSKGPRPTISVPPAVITYGGSFNINVISGDKITKVSLVRLGSVTHSFNQNQLLNFLNFEQVNSLVTVQAPSNANVAPPGHYMLFFLNQQGVPSIAPIVRVAAQAIVPPVRQVTLAQRTTTAVPVTIDLAALDMQIVTNQTTLPIVVGVSPSCPYGIGACWGGALDALQRLNDISAVRPLPDTTNSTAFVYTQRDMLPDLDVWRDEFANFANGTYVMRGIEMTLSSLVTEQSSKLTLAGTATRPQIALTPLQAADIIQWDINTRASRPMSDLEANAFARLSAEVAARPATVQVTGPLKKNGAAFFLEVREFKVETA